MVRQMLVFYEITLKFLISSYFWKKNFFSPKFIKTTPCPLLKPIHRGVTKRCRLSWLTNSALVYESKCGGKVGVVGSQPMSTAVHRSPNNFRRSYSIFYLCLYRRVPRIGRGHVGLGQSLGHEIYLMKFRELQNTAT